MTVNEVTNIISHVVQTILTLPHVIKHSQCVSNLSMSDSKLVSIEMKNVTEMGKLNEWVTFCSNRQVVLSRPWILLPWKLFTI